MRGESVKKQQLLVLSALLNYRYHARRRVQAGITLVTRPKGVVLLSELRQVVAVRVNMDDNFRFKLLNQPSIERWTRQSEGESMLSYRRPRHGTWTKHAKTQYSARHILGPYTVVKATKSGSTKKVSAYRLRRDAKTWLQIYALFCDGGFVERERYFHSDYFNDFFETRFWPTASEVCRLTGFEGKMRFQKDGSDFTNYLETMRVTGLQKIVTVCLLDPRRLEYLRQSSAALTKAFGKEAADELQKLGFLLNTLAFDSTTGPYLEISRWIHLTDYVDDGSNVTAAVQAKCMKFLDAFTKELGDMKLAHKARLIRRDYQRDYEQRTNLKSYLKEKRKIRRRVSRGLPPWEGA
jgi:hypothetical protein